MTTISKISQSEHTLLNYLGLSLKQFDIPHLNSTLNAEVNDEELEDIFEIADRHEVLALLENMSYSDRLTGKHSLTVQDKTARTVHKGIKLQALNTKITALLEKEGVKAVTLKGGAVARFYPVPEFRKTTDIDLFVFSKEDAQKAGRILCENGFKFSQLWHANHHIVLVSEKGETVEIHLSWAEAFREKRLNQYLEKIQKESRNHCQPIDCQGEKIFAYETAFQGFYLLIHMFQHFVGSGFGLRNLCDWVVLWENCDDEKARKDFRKMVCESGTEKFAQAVTSVCVNYLGLSKEKSPFSEDSLTEQEVTDELLRDILDAGEFGYSEPERMVGMDGNSLMTYIKEFHHQMHINFPKSGRMILFWPVLWLATLIRFLKNNKKYNRAPVTAIMKKAGKRGELVKQLL